MAEQSHGQALGEPGMSAHRAIPDKEWIHLEGWEQRA